MKQKQPRQLWSERTERDKVWLVVGALIFLTMLVACIVGGVQAAQQSGAQGAQANATATSQALTPTPTPTLVHRITDIVTHHKPDGTSDELEGVITGATENGSVYRVDVTVKATLLGAVTERGVIQRDTYDIMDALYASNLYPTSVTVRVFGPFTDKYGNTSNQQWAAAVLTKPTEEKFNWAGLTYRSAWAVYDQAEYLMDWLQE